MAEKEAMLRLQGDYAADIRMCDRIETEPPRMADDMFCGLSMRSRGTHNGRHPMVSPAACERRTNACLHSVCKQRRRQIAVAGVRKKHDNGLTLVLRALGQLNCRPDGSAGISGA